jgi:hypothetical protein
MSNDEQRAPVEPPKPKRLARERFSSFADFLGRHERIFNVLSTTVTAIFTAVLATSTVFLWKETKDLRDFAQEQSADMKASIAEASRAATAMQNVATAVANSAKASNESLEVFKDANIRQMRAYLTVGLGGFVPQDKATGYRLEVRMSLQNTGNTPAYNVRYVSRVEILPFPLPADFALPKLSPAESSTILGPHQNLILTGIAPTIYSDEDINEIQYDIHKQLFAYGTVAYEDAFGNHRTTNFFQRLVWLKGGNVMSFNMPDHNDAD